MKMYCKIKRPDNAKYQIEKGTRVVIQEKIDGSNTAIYNDNGKIRLYSRSKELTGEDGLNGFVKYARERENKILEYLPNGYVLYGEWLNQGKISYNSLAKQGKIEPYYAFDLVQEIVDKPTEDEDFTRIFASIEEMKEISNKIGFKTVPEIAVENLTSYDELKERYVDNQKSALGGTDCIREGIVIKTPMRICKFLTQIEIESPKPEDYREIFKKLDIIANDILEEEKEQILKDIARIIKKQAIPNIKEYVDNN